MASWAHTLRLFVAHYGLAALFVLLVLEEAGVWLPLPGDLFVMYVGAQASRAPMPVLAAVPALLVVTAAVLCGSLILYAVTRRFRGQVRRLGRFIRLDEQRLTWMEAWLRRHGARVLIPGRLIPGLRIPTTVVAGLFDLPLAMFVPAVAVGGAVWGAFYLILGALGQTLLYNSADLREDAPLPDATGEWLMAALALLLIVAAGGLWRYHRTHQRQP
jgi:membrane-associated protein